MIRTEKLSAGYDKLQILFDVDVKAEKGKITTIVGPNGSGKSTFLKTVFGLTTIYSGKIYLEDNEITNVPPHGKTKFGMAYLPQTNNVFTNLTIKENLEIAGYILNKDKTKEGIEFALSVFPELKDLLNRKAGTLSGGQRQFLAMATALVRETKVLMLDEPTAQLSPKLADVIFNKILELRDEHNMAILLVEQNAKKALEISDKGYMFVSGSVAYEGPAKELLEHEKFQSYFLGLVNEEKGD
ncbi:MAG: branched-chain amino acid transport system ATP-binding protein [Methanothermococcus sp.]|uniref:branched-chain amino acid ABC transporter ATP-binding protein n=1 Tax=Methanothermococcus TaxID=155862 RepID=UPI0003628A93|nr:MULTISPECIES: ABC transporter ATP-binding protein [Methanothermococcus]MDK2789658.1 branched-chain amino acid transport system ATP-binding protein [Methanothermococcus sp.]MDK2988102.1 branched-chain amino acid transport system ATP-binding protein [Methanothermococcus sp.]